MRPRRIRPSFLDRRRLENELGHWAYLGIPVLEAGAVLPNEAGPRMVRRMQQLGLDDDKRRVSFDVRYNEALRERVKILAAAREVTVSSIIWGAAILGAAIDLAADPSTT
jgi:hypothetical protein